MGLVKMGAVKGFLRKNKMRMSKDLRETLEEKMKGMLQIACFRAEKNGRHTVMIQDI